MSEVTQPLQVPRADDPFAAVSALADELTKTMAVARSLVSSGRRIDLTDLDNSVGLLCAKSLDLPPQAGRVMRPRLIVLLSEVDALLRELAPCAAPLG